MANLLTGVSIRSIKLGLQNGRSFGPLHTLSVNVFGLAWLRPQQTWRLRSPNRASLTEMIVPESMETSSRILKNGSTPTSEANRLFDHSFLLLQRNMLSSAEPWLHTPTANPSKGLQPWH